MSFLDRVKYYVPGILRNMMIPAAERRSKSLCPLCDYKCNLDKVTWNVIPQYTFLCSRCNLYYRKSYLDHKDDDIYILQILATCPECLKHHIPQIVGEVTTDEIPCDPCWSKNNKPFDPDETQLILLPGHVPDDDESTELLEIYLPALYRKRN